MNTAGAVGSILFPALAPWLVDVTGSWDAVLAAFAGTYVAAGACWCLFNPDHHRT
jgi:ACS family glucarate transporter-like MFS transporter